ncbi:MAG: hypothetical protein NC548_42140 [Lachnospiraceae bacterium]|nr:hypothetical protein [Lachnospiraceae bacterium]
METEKIQVNLAPGCEDATIRLIELNKDQSRLPVLEPVKIEIEGILGCVAEYLQKRLSTGQFCQSDCHILVDREEMTIALITNETDSRRRATIIGSLSFYPKYIQFGINNPEKQWSPAQLGNFFKLNRAFFANVEDNMMLVTTLKNFSAKVNQTVEKSREDNGSRSDTFSQVVNSNLPKSFTVNMPIFKGRGVEQIEVELIADVDGRDIKLSLCSPGAEVIVEEQRNAAIDEQLSLITSIAPDIAIIEQ